MVQVHIHKHTQIFIHKSKTHSKNVSNNRYLLGYTTIQDNNISTCVNPRRPLNKQIIGLEEICIGSCIHLSLMMILYYYNFYCCGSHIQIPILIDFTQNIIWTLKLSLMLPSTKMNIKQMNMPVFKS